MTPPADAPPETFDQLLTLLGTGRWTFLYMAMLVLRLLLQPSHAMSGVFLAPSHAHTCRPLPAHLNITVSRDACHYVISRPTPGGALGEAEEEVKVPCTQWDFDSSSFTSSLTSDYDWVCERDHFRALYQSLYMMGTTVSPLLCGYLADRFGRKKVLVAAHVALSGASLAICLVHSLPLLLVLRFIVGFSDILTGFVLTLEVCEPKHRATIAILTGLGWSVGTAVWGCLAYFLRAWRSLQLAASLPTLVMFPILFFLDESPRWLIVSGQHEKARRVLQKAARWNKATLPHQDHLGHLFSRVCKEEESQLTKTPTTTAASSHKRFWRPKLFWNKEIAVVTLATALCYFCVALVYDGLTLAGDLYSDNLYLYMVFSGLVEMPSILLAAPVVHRLGRKAPIVACLLGCGVVNIAISFLQSLNRSAAFVAAMAGKLLVGAAFQILYLYSSELFPTEVRVSGVEGASAVGQVGAAIAPYFSTYLGPMVPWLPSTVYGIISMLTGLTTMLLRETKDSPLPETIAELRKPAKDRLRRKRISEGGLEDDGEPDASTALQEQRCDA